MTQVKTNLRWAGGKSRMMKVLDDFLPDGVDRYLEPFTGGGSVLLYILQKYHPSVAYANDIDKLLINYYKSVQEDPQKVIDECLEILKSYDAEQFREVFDDLDRTKASGFFTKNKTSFSGLNNNYSIQTYGSRFSEKSINKISDVSRVIKDTKFINCDFKSLDETIGESIKDFFIYLDPPYYGNKKTRLYGEKGRLHTEFDHEGLKKWVDEHNGENRIMISYDDTPYVRELYKDYFIYDFDFVYSMSNIGGTECRMGKEIVITNYEVKR